jgi:hypothetical protein
MGMPGGQGVQILGTKSCYQGTGEVLGGLASGLGQIGVQKSGNI